MNLKGADIVKGLAAVVIGLGFAIMPLLADKAKLTPIWIAILVSATTLIAAAIAMPIIQSGITPIPNNKALILGGIGCMANAIAFIIYGAFIHNKVMPISNLVAVVSISMIANATILGILFSGESLSRDKLIGLLFSIGTIYFLVIKSSINQPS